MPQGPQFSTNTIIQQFNRQHRYSGLPYKKRRKLLKEFFEHCLTKRGAGTPVAPKQKEDDMPVGSFIHYMGWADFTDSNGFVWLLCNGQSVAKATYPALYNLTKMGGSTCKWGETTTHFTLPDLTNRKFRGTATQEWVGNTGGWDSYTLNTFNMPPHTHTVPDHNHTLTLPQKGGVTSGTGYSAGYSVHDTSWSNIAKTTNSVTGVTTGSTGGVGGAATSFSLVNRHMLMGTFVRAA